MKHRNSHFAVGYWSLIRKGRAVPDQADIDPKSLKRLLPFVFLLDARATGQLTYRLAGTTLCERYGGELRGRNFLSHWDAGSQAKLRGLLREALTRCLPACITSIAATQDCRMVEVETVLMPISFANTVPERFLGVAQVLSDVTPLAGRSIAFERLVGCDLIHEGAADAPAQPPSEPPSAPPLERALERVHPRAPYLRLVASNPDRTADPLHFGLDETIQSLLAFCGRAGGALPKKPL
jgi:hypothetical protein